MSHKDVRRFTQTQLDNIAQQAAQKCACSLIDPDIDKVLFVQRLFDTIKVELMAYGNIHIATNVEKYSGGERMSKSIVTSSIVASSGDKYNLDSIPSVGVVRPIDIHIDLKKMSPQKVESDRSKSV
jgi:hypothetical protein